MTKIRLITGYFTIASIIIMFAYDGFVYLKFGQDATISSVIIDMSYEQPSVVFFVGFVMGHLFWRMKKRGEK